MELQVFWCWGLDFSGDEVVNFSHFFARGIEIRFQKETVMKVLEKYYKRELIASAIWFIVVVWFVGWKLALLLSAILFILNMVVVDYLIKERRRPKKRVDEAFLCKEAERIEAQRSNFRDSP